ncbi:MAG: GNAT family N-acetyltransferase [Clostridiales bacterium]|nr:GNAT family N-acetyltransferase [Clostridiales bacterium]
MRLRLLTPEDYDALYALWLSCPGMGLNDRDDSREGIAAYLRRNPATCFGAEEDGRLIGCILAGHDGRRGFIHHTAVRPDCQRRGIGAALASAALEALKQEGITKVALLVFRRNEPGNAFWEKQGFTLREDICYRNLALADMTRIDT